MDRIAAKQVLDIFVENGARILRAGFGVNMAESSFFDVIKILRLEPDLKEYFLSRVQQVFDLKEPGDLSAGMIPRELIELVVHELKWKEIRDMAERRIAREFNGDRKLAIGDVALTVQDAYSDDWRDREFYAHYT